jgi:hypothetical protein
MSSRRHERLPDASALRRANRDVLQVGVRGRQPPGCGDRLVIGRVHAARCLGNLQRQLVGVGALELAHAAIVDDHTRQLIVVGKLGKHVLGCRRLALRRLADDRELLLLEQNLLQLLR